MLTFILLIEHINECVNKQVQVADGVKPEDIECEICYEKVLSKADARFGLLSKLPRNFFKFFVN